MARCSRRKRKRDAYLRAGVTCEFNASRELLLDEKLEQAHAERRLPSGLGAAGDSNSVVTNDKQRFAAFRGRRDANFPHPAAGKRVFETIHEQLVQDEAA